MQKMKLDVAGPLLPKLVLILKEISNFSIFQMLIEKDLLKLTTIHNV